MTVREELPMLSDGAGICGSGDSITGPLCIAVSILIEIAVAIW
jgi:hypothetical protein